MELIYIKNLSKAYGKTRVLDNLSVSYESGKIYGLVGENGAGKTTLFSCIMGVTDYPTTPPVTLSLFSIFMSLLFCPSPFLYNFCIPSLCSSILYLKFLI